MQYVLRLFLFSTKSDMNCIRIGLSNKLPFHSLVQIPMIWFQKNTVSIELILGSTCPEEGFYTPHEAVSEEGQPSGL